MKQNAVMGMTACAKGQIFWHRFPRCRSCPLGHSSCPSCPCESFLPLSSTGSYGLHIHSRLSWIIINLIQSHKWDYSEKRDTLISFVFFLFFNYHSKCKKQTLIWLTFQHSVWSCCLKQRHPMLERCFYPSCSTFDLAPWWHTWENSRRQPRYVSGCHAFGNPKWRPWFLLQFFAEWNIKWQPFSLFLFPSLSIPDCETCEKCSL